MKANYYKPTAKEKNAMLKEIKREIVAQRKEFFHDIDTMILWTLHVELGFGIIEKCVKRLKWIRRIRQNVSSKRSASIWKS